MQIIITYCEICGKQKPDHIKHWTQEWGTVVLDFSNILTLQYDKYIYSDVCPDCGTKILEDLKSTFNKLRGV